MAMRRLLLASLLGSVGAVAPLPATAEEPADVSADWSLHAQLTGVYQGDAAFHSPYQGPNSLSGDTQIRESLSGTLYLGRRLPWQGGELYFNPEFNQGFGLSRTEGVEGFPNGEAQKAGFDTPKPNVARLFVRQTFGLGGEQEQIDDDDNQLARPVDIARVTLTGGKFSASDVFDDNRYAHDARTQFLNLSFWEAAAWDYPADAKGYTDGIAAELNQKRWALRAGYFLVPKIANQRDLDPRFAKRFATVVELETRHELWSEPGKLRFLVFANRAPQASLGEAVALAQASGAAPDTTALRRDSWKAGFAVNLEQALSDALGVFARVSWNDGKTEGWSFNDINNSFAVGASLEGVRWGRPDDTVGLAGAVNRASQALQRFLTAGGAGILAGDGRLSYAPEAIIETYYSLQVVRPVAVSLDYQFVANPAFNRDRGPVSIFAVRVHLHY